MTNDCWRARDRAKPEEIVMAAADCTKDEFVEALVTKYGYAWVHGTAAFGSRFIIEPITRRVFDAYASCSEWAAVDPRPS